MALTDDRGRIETVETAKAGKITSTIVLFLRRKLGRHPAGVLAKNGPQGPLISVSSLRELVAYLPTEMRESISPILQMIEANPAVAEWANGAVAYVALNLYPFLTETFGEFLSIANSPMIGSGVVLYGLLKDAYRMDTELQAVLTKVTMQSYTTVRAMSGIKDLYTELSDTCEKHSGASGGQGLFGLGKDFVSWGVQLFLAMFKSSPTIADLKNHAPMLQFAFLAAANYGGEAERVWSEGLQKKDGDSVSIKEFAEWLRADLGIADGRSVFRDVFRSKAPVGKRAFLAAVGKVLFHATERAGPKRDRIAAV